MPQVLKAGEAAQRYVAAFQAHSGNGAGKAPGWLKERRGAAIARFAEAGFPSTRQEAWRFTDVKPIAAADFTLAPAPDIASLDRRAVQGLLLGDAGRLATAVFVNGHFAEALSTVEGLPATVRLGSLRAALRRDGDLVQEHLARYASDERNPFTALNTAFIGDGAFVYVPKGTVLKQPLQLLFLTVPQAGPQLVSHPRNLVIVGRDAQASVVESYVGLHDSAYWTNAVTEMVIGENAHVDVYRVQQESEQAFHTATTHSYGARNSVYSSVTFALGSALSRHDIIAVLDGEGAECTLDGLSVLRGRQHVDFHTTLEHAKPHCTSWEFFNGVFDERARGVFSGRIVVQPGAQRTDSKQTNNNLLLSRQARADSQPQLEIYADDVKCTHGATLGPIDPQQLFYLQSRGLAPDDARNLLTYGFCAEVLNTVTLDALKRRMDGLVQERLAEGARRRQSAA